MPWQWVPESEHKFILNLLYLPIYLSFHVFAILSFLVWVLFFFILKNPFTISYSEDSLAVSSLQFCLSESI